MKTHEKDLEYWNKWKKTKKPGDLSNLLKQVNPIIKNTVFQLKGSLSPVVLEAEAKLQAVKAFNTFKPEKKVQLSTHLTNYLQKVNRLNYKHQEVYSVPEARRIKYHTFDVTKSHLRDELDRDPTVEEMADSLKWSNAEVGRHFKETRKELSDSQPISHDFFAVKKDDDSSMLAYVYNDLAPKEKLLFEHTTGFGGKNILNNTQLMHKLNMTQGQLSYAKKNLAVKLKEVTRGY